MHFVATGPGRWREIRKRVEALDARLSVFQADIDLTEVHLRRGRLHSQCAAGEGRLGEHPSHDREDRERRPAQDRDAQSSTGTPRPRRGRLNMTGHSTYPPGPETFACERSLATPFIRRRSISPLLNQSQ